MKLLQINPNAGPADCYVTAADGVVCPAYEMRERVIDGEYVWTWYVHHPTEGVHALTPARLGALYAAGRVTTQPVTTPPAAPLALVVTTELPVETPRRAPSARQARLRRVDMQVPLREKLRRLLNARATSLHKITGEYVDDVRHEAVWDATDGRTDSSMGRTVTEEEMGDACTFVEDRLFHAGFDFDAEDAAYWERRAARETLPTRAPARRLAA